jgi:HPt (histidine-containing phosphotransfer) domain-containing protein
MAALELALKEGVAEHVRSAAHAFKSGAGTIRANALAARLQELETAGRSGSLEATTPLIGQIRDEYLAVQRQLTTTIADAG